MVVWEIQVVGVKMTDEFIEQKPHIHAQPQTRFLILKISGSVHQISEC